MRNCEYIGNPAMFQSRVMGVGSMGPRPVDPTETYFNPAGKIYETRILDHPTYGKQTITYTLQVMVKDYVPGSGQVKYTTWGNGMYPGYNPMPSWNTISEDQFVAMFPEWTSVRARKFGSPTPSPVPTPTPTPTPAPAKPTAFSLPLLLGAAYLMLS